MLNTVQGHQPPSKERTSAQEFLPRTAKPKYSPFDVAEIVRTFG
jgi:hypothetical protein